MCPLERTVCHPLKQVYAPPRTDARAPLEGV